MARAGRAPPCQHHLRERHLARRRWRRDLRRPEDRDLTPLEVPVFSGAEDNNVGGSLSLVGLRTCWLGALRNSVHGSVVAVGNTMADPDASEFLANAIRGNIWA